MRVLQINTISNSGSTGRIAEGLGLVLLNKGHESYIAASRIKGQSSSKVIQIGSRLDIMGHVISTRIFDNHGFTSSRETLKLINRIDEINPDIVSLHNLHGYYLNVELLFEYLKVSQRAVTWTFHDCWPFTGHCTYFDSENCSKWKVECNACPKKASYPQSWIFDRSTINYFRKRQAFNGLKNLVIITPSRWLKDQVSSSFLNNYPIHVIHNGVDTKVFQPLSVAKCIDSRINVNQKIILGVASIWDKRKGLYDFVELRKLLGGEYQIVLIGLSTTQINKLPPGIVGIARTESVEQLTTYYSIASVFVNPTSQDNFPTTNLEALACGTPVVTYNTGGSPEAIDSQTGIIVDKGDIRQLGSAVETVCANGKTHYINKCRERAVEMFNKENQYTEYVDIFRSMIERNSKSQSNSDN